MIDLPRTRHGILAFDNPVLKWHAVKVPNGNHLDEQARTFAAMRCRFIRLWRDMWHGYDSAKVKGYIDISRTPPSEPGWRGYLHPQRAALVKEMERAKRRGDEF